MVESKSDGRADGRGRRAKSPKPHMISAIFPIPTVMPTVNNNVQASRLAPLRYTSAQGWIPMQVLSSLSGQLAERAIDSSVSPSSETAPRAADPMDLNHARKSVAVTQLDVLTPRQSKCILVIRR